MQTSFRIFQLLKIRNQMSSRTLRNYGLYSALVLLVIYNLADFAVDVGTLFLITLVLTSFVAAERQFFPQVKDTMNSIHFLTTPSQQWEKWLAEFIHTFFIIPIIAIIPVMSAVLIVKLFSFSANNLYISADGLYFAIKKILDNAPTVILWRYLFPPFSINQNLWLNRFTCHCLRFVCGRAHQLISSYRS